MDLSLLLEKTIASWNVQAVDHETLPRTPSQRSKYQVDILQINNTSRVPCTPRGCCLLDYGYFETCISNVSKEQTWSRADFYTGGGHSIPVQLLMQLSQN